MFDSTKLKNGIKRAGLLASTAFMSAASGVTPALADGPTNPTTGTGQTDFFENNEAAIKIIEKVAKLYQTWSLPFIFITAIVWAVTKDDKAKQIEKKALVGMIAVYILMSAARLIVESFTDFGKSILGG